MEKEIQAIRSKLWCGNGPCMEELTKQLKQIGAERQAYHGETFNGNHTHKCLKEKNINLLANLQTAVYSKVMPNLMEEGNSIEQKFKNKLDSFGKCHRIYTKKEKLSNEEIMILEKEIKTFMELYRLNFPQATILPKMHFLEHHMITWVKRYNTLQAIYFVLEKQLEAMKHLKH